MGKDHSGNKSNRVKVQPFAYKVSTGDEVGGESLEMRASGFWIDEQTKDHYPVFLHMTVYSGCGAFVQCIGDCVKIVQGSS